LTPVAAELDGVGWTTASGSGALEQPEAKEATTIKIRRETFTLV
jgi:hypothetical protein